MLRSQVLCRQGKMSCEPTSTSRSLEGLTRYAVHLACHQRRYSLGVFLRLRCLNTLQNNVQMEPGYAASLKLYMRDR